MSSASFGKVCRFAGGPIHPRVARRTVPLNRGIASDSRHPVEVGIEAGEGGQSVLLHDSGLRYETLS